jgi:hypothetical protein
MVEQALGQCLALPYAVQAGTGRPRKTAGYLCAHPDVHQFSTVRLHGIRVAVGRVARDSILLIRIEFSQSKESGSSPIVQMVHRNQAVGRGGVL